MKIEYEVTTIKGNDYIILSEVKSQNNTYLVLSNVNDMDDVIIQKRSSEDNTTVIPLDDEEENKFAWDLYLKSILSPKKNTD